MRYEPLDPKLFTENRARLARFLPTKAIAVLNANDILPTNADGTLRCGPNRISFTSRASNRSRAMLLLYPDADDEKEREILFLREPQPMSGDVGRPQADARTRPQKLTGIERRSTG